MPLKMKRGRTQALFNFLPGQPFNWQGRQGSFIGTKDVDTNELDIPRSWVRRALARLVQPFVASARRANKEFPGLRVIEADRFELREPRRFRAELFPRTYICHHCDLFFESNDAPRRVRCAKCGSMNCAQFSFVEFHRCGYAGALIAPQCANRCSDGMRLLNRQSRRIADWVWKCSRCGTRAARGLYHGCPGCSAGQVKVLRADANAVFYTQYVKVVNPPRREDTTLLEAPNIHDAAIAQGMGGIAPGLKSIQRAVNEPTGSAVVAQARADLIEKYGLDEDDELLDEMLTRLEKQRSGSGDWQDKVMRLNLSPERIDDLGHECLELALASEASPVSIQDLIDQAPDAAFRAMYEKAYPAALGKYGFDDVTLLREFPLAYIAAGYTREERDPESAGVMFNFFEGQADKYPMFGQRSETEALLFKLSPEAVVDWLVTAGIASPPTDQTAREWLFAVMQPVESIFAPPADRITEAVLGLVHSVSHRALKALAGRSGLSKDSLSEYLLPANTAFLIYADTRSEFVLGGLEHTFRNRLVEALNQMDNDRRCVFDPPCRDREGACAFCMYLGEISCERFNTVLSRHYLFGGEHGGVTWPPFWTI
jgi:DNA-directed RNA polymerase subunit RPC12/RpoP